MVNFNVFLCVFLVLPLSPVTGTACFLASNTPDSFLSPFVVDGNWCLAVCNDFVCL